MTLTNPPTIEDQLSQLTQIVGHLAQQVQAGQANAATPAAPVAPVVVPDQSEIAPPPVGSIVRQELLVPGAEAATTTYGIVVAIDPEINENGKPVNTAQVAWLPAPTNVRGDAITKVE